MEVYCAVFLPALLTGVLFRLILIPVKPVYRLLLHSGSGLLCLWLLHSLGRYTGVFLPYTLENLLIAGVLGAPGLGILTIIQVLSL